MDTAIWRPSPSARPDTTLRAHPMPWSTPGLRLRRARPARSPPGGSASSGFGRSGGRGGTSRGSPGRRRPAGTLTGGRPGRRPGAGSVRVGTCPLACPRRRASRCRWSLRSPPFLAAASCLDPGLRAVCLTGRLALRLRWPAPCPRAILSGRHELLPLVLPLSDQETSGPLSICPSSGHSGRTANLPRARPALSGTATFSTE